MRILVADDHQLFIDGIRHILNKLDAVVEVIESNRAAHAIETLESGQTFDLILIDLSMPGMDGMSILQRMRERKAWLPLVVVSAEENIRTIKATLDAGALGFIPKAHSGRQMLAALNAILEGEVYIPADIEKQIDNLVSRKSSTDTGITKRQLAVLELLAKGYSNKQIATSLYLTEHTVKAHIAALFSTLKAHNRTECVQFALREGILTSQ